MIVDAATSPPPAELTTDVLVVGAGAAGITLALELASESFDVLLLESGGETATRETAELGLATMSGEPDYPLAASRVRALGGTTQSWTGFCHPLERADVEGRSWVDAGRWPIDYAELAGYYERAQELVEVGPEPFDLGEWRDALASEALTPLESQDLTAALFRIGPPTRFGDRYRRDLETAPQLTVMLHASVTKLVTTADGGAVTSVEVATGDGARSRVTAGIVVLATGGLEVPRMLLASNGARPEGVGNRNDVVGRNFMEHPHLELGTIVLTDEVDLGTRLMYGIGVPVADRQLYSHFRLSEEAQERYSLLGLGATLVDATRDARPETGAVEALVGDVEGRDAEAFGFFVRAEQLPRPENRVTLGRETDRFGVPRLHLHWEVSERERQSHVESVRLIAAELGKLGVGRIGLHAERGADVAGIGGGHHHMGTARMSEDPAEGVVDANLRVHGVDNLYVASSAVFPTSGWANPTLTIVALTVRLAGHLRELGRSR